ncbi:hypothetical protein [Roseiconus lacunae]|uniref:Uncharacterized protein n=1 Tax=Roseiconus lacunae TaxID=2605694 RepID=A0ABT7PMF4_9BACT|nr:hypothetical protein [Roseiconus lacunae]MCD0460368.1 hypothetical protein [Roseiconus lacunae]MDM4017697.1 hypothetical protein [Roseiconus lacunae]
MKKTLLLALSVILFLPNVRADDFTLRVTTLGYENAENGPGDLRRLPSNLRKLIPGVGGGRDGEGDRKETILRSVETQIIPGEKFAVSYRNDAEIIELRGSSTRDNGASLKISLYYKYSKVTAEAMEAIRLAEGDASKRQRILKLLPGASTQRTISLKTGDSVTLSEFFGVTEGVDKAKSPKKYSANRVVLSLVDRNLDGRKSAEPSVPERD